MNVVTPGSRRAFTAAVEREQNALVAAQPQEALEQVMANNELLFESAGLPGDTLEEMASAARERELHDDERARNLSRWGAGMSTVGTLGMLGSLVLGHQWMLPGLAVTGSVWLAGKMMASYGSRNRQNHFWRNYAYNPTLSTHLEGWQQKSQQLPPAPPALPECVPESVRRVIERQHEWLGPEQVTTEKLAESLERGGDPASALGIDPYLLEYTDYGREARTARWLHSQGERSAAELDRTLDKEISRRELLGREIYPAVASLGTAVLVCSFFSGGQIPLLLGIGAKLGTWVLLDARSGPNLRGKNDRALRQAEDRRQLIRYQTARLGMEDALERTQGLHQAREAAKVYMLANPDKPTNLEETDTGVLVGGVALKKKSGKIAPTGEAPPE